MDDSIIELEHSILNGWIANNFHSYINNNEILHDNSMSLLDAQVQDLTNREYQLVNELNNCKQMLDTERTDRIILLKLLEDKDHLIRQLQTQLSQRISSRSFDNGSDIAQKKTNQSIVHLTDEELSDDFSKVENEIILLLSQNKKLKHKANKTIKHRKPDEHNPLNLSVTEDYMALRKMIDIQEEIELRLTTEVSGLRSTVQQQDCLLKEWEPIINEFKIANSAHKSGGNVSKSDKSERNIETRKHHHHRRTQHNNEQKEDAQTEKTEKERNHTSHTARNSHQSHSNHITNQMRSTSQDDDDEAPLRGREGGGGGGSRSVSPIPAHHSPSSSPSPIASFSNHTPSSPHSSRTSSGTAGRFSSDKIRHDLDRLLDEISHVTDVNSRRQSPLVSPMGYHK